MKIGTLVSLTVGICLAIATIIVVGVTFGELTTKVPDWIDLTEARLIASQEQHLQTDSDTLSRVLTSTFGQVFTEVETVVAQSEALFGDEYVVDFQRESYNGVQSIDPRTPPGGLTSRRYSAWYDHSAVNTTLLEITAALDHFLAPPVIGNPAITSVYLGFEEEAQDSPGEELPGLWRLFPYGRLNNFPTLKYICAYSGQQVTGYDPKCRDWYQLAVASPRTTVATAPYQDAATGDTLVTVARTVHGLTGELIGVVGADLTMTAVEQQVSDPILTEGYSFVLDSTGRLIFYPDLPRNRVYTVEEREFSNADDRSAFAATLTRIEAGESFEGTYTKNDELWYFAARPIPGTDYRLVSTVPEADVIRDARDARDQAEKMFTLMIILIVVIGAVLLFSFGFLIRSVVDEVIEPLNLIAQANASVASGNLGTDLDGAKVRSRDMGAAVTKIQQLIEIIRFSNGAYYQGKWQEALAALVKVEAVLKSVNNQEGVAKVYNNRGNIEMLLEGVVENHLTEAERHLRESVRMAAVEVQKTTNEPDEQIFHRLNEASRRNNLARVLRLQGRLDEAELELNSSITIYRDVQSKHDRDCGYGEMEAIGNLGLVYVDRGQADVAFRMFSEAHAIAANRYAANPTVDNGRLLQQSLLNLGHHYQLMQQWELARNHLVAAYRCCPQVEQRIKIEAQHRLLEVLTVMFGPSNSDVIELGQELAPPTLPQSYTFLLDTSGSMANSRINATQQALKQIINLMQPEDLVTIITFSTSRATRIRNASVQTRRAEIDQVIDQLSAYGGTAFYDAVSRTADEAVADDIPDDRQKLILMTDGADGGSTTTLETLTTKLMKLKLQHVVVGVLISGNYGSNLTQIAETSTLRLDDPTTGPKSKVPYLNANNVGEIATVFEQAFQALAAPVGGGRMEGF